MSLFYLTITPIAYAAEPISEPALASQETAQVPKTSAMALSLQKILKAPKSHYLAQRKTLFIEGCFTPGRALPELLEEYRSAHTLNDSAAKRSAADKSIKDISQPIDKAFIDE